MPVRIDAKNDKLSDGTKDHIEQVCDKFSQFYDRIVDIEVIVDTQNKHKQSDHVEIIVKVPGQRIVGTGEAEENLYKAIDEAAGHVQRQLKKFHDKKADHR